MGRLESLAGLVLGCKALYHNYDFLLINICNYIHEYVNEIIWRIILARLQYTHSSIVFKDKVTLFFLKQWTVANKPPNKTCTTLSFVSHYNVTKRIQSALFEKTNWFISRLPIRKNFFIHKIIILRLIMYLSSLNLFFFLQVRVGFCGLRYRFWHTGAVPQILFQPFLVPGSVLVSWAMV